MAKTRIIDLLGERTLLLPALLNAAIIANEQAKYILGVLQLAAANADNPSAAAATLRTEREACGLDEARLDRVIARSESLGPGVYHVPEAAHLVALLGEALDAMLAPLALIPEEAASHRAFVERKQHLLDAIPQIDGDIIGGDAIAALTSGRPAGGDGVHLLVMDLHKVLNRLQAGIAEEDIDGAKVYGLTAADRPLIATFMRGVHRTEPLKFDHPGLAATAARHGGTLSIQNDIGETDAHVLVVRISGLHASLTYSDVHPQRLKFFQQVLAVTGMTWEETRSQQAAGLAEDDLFYLVAGTLTADDEGALAAFLERLGSRLVFLIDWNRARKRLGLLVPNSVAVELLGWACEQDIGHRAFLQLGGERLIYDALEQAVRTPLRYGEMLHEMIGLAEAGDYLRFVLETAASGLRDGRSPMLIRDRIRAELFGHFRSAEERLLMDGSKHAAIVARLAQGLSVALHNGEAFGGNTFARNAETAKRLETEADDILRTVRATSRRIAGTGIFCRIVEIADDAADSLEEAAFLAAVRIDGGSNAPLPRPLAELAALVLDGARSFQQTLEAAPLVRRGGDREPITNFLEAADRVTTTEHRTDQQQRNVTIALMASPIDGRVLYLVDAVTRHLERAADSLMRASLVLRDHILGDAVF
ncbi:MAG: hypothetical protein ACM3JG_10255 [Thiohalocapsa sp.]